MAQIAVVGAGYVGLSAAACLTELGHDVVSTDNNAALIDSLRNGDVQIHEPNLPELVLRGLRSGKLKFTVDSSAVGDNRSVCDSLPSDTNDAWWFGRYLSTCGLRDESLPSLLREFDCDYEVNCASWNDSQALLGGRETRGEVCIES